MINGIDQDVRNAAEEIAAAFGYSPDAEFRWLAPIIARIKAAGRVQGMREAVEVARSFNRAECYQTFIPLDDIATAIESLLSEKPA